MSIRISLVFYYHKQYCSQHHWSKASLHINTPSHQLTEISEGAWFCRFLPTPPKVMHSHLGIFWFPNLRRLNSPLPPPCLGMRREAAETCTRSLLLRSWSTKTNELCLQHLQIDLPWPQKSLSVFSHPGTHIHQPSFSNQLPWQVVVAYRLFPLKSSSTESGIAGALGVAMKLSTGEKAQLWPALHLKTQNHLHCSLVTSELRPQ